MATSVKNHTIAGLTSKLYEQADAVANGTANLGEAQALVKIANAVTSQYRLQLEAIKLAGGDLAKATKMLNA